MKVTEFIRKIRAKAQDNDEIRFSDYDILREINVAYKVFRQICVTDAPELIEETYECKLPKDENRIIFSQTIINKDYAEKEDEEELEHTNYIACNPIKIVEMRSRGRVLHNASMRNIVDTEDKGYPTQYVLGNIEGHRCLRVFPIPANPVTVALTLIDETKELTTDGDINIPGDYAYYVVEFVVKSLAGAGDVGEFKEAIKIKLNEIAPGPCVVDSYY